MTVGVPEINLDTWGLKYVKKKSSTQDIDIGTGSGTPASPKHTGLPESKRPRSEGQQAGAGFESGKPSQNISATTRISDADVKTPESPKQVHETQGSDKKRQYTHGKEVPVGSDTGIEVGASKKLTARGKPSDTRNVQNPAASDAGREASHESGIQSVETRSGKDRSGVKVEGYVEDKKPHNIGGKEFTRPSGFRVEGEKKGKPAHNALPKAKAEMELAIIKCKLLKMNDISKRGEWDHLPHAQKEKEEDEKVEKGHKDVDDVSGEVRNVDDEKYSQGKYNSPHSEVGIQSGEIKPHPKPVKGEHTEDTKYTSQAGEELGSGKEGRKRFESDSKKSDEIVEKAIELINEAYGEIQDINKKRPQKDGYAKCPHCSTEMSSQQWIVDHVAEQHPNKKEAKKDAPSTTSSEGGFNHVYSDVHEAKRQKQEQ